MSESTPITPEAPVQFPAIAAEIDAMTVVDQRMRHNLRSGGEWDFTIDANNTARMKEIIAEIGWPTVSKVGKLPSSNAWLLVQHADRDVAFQEACLALLKQEPAGEVDPRDIAMLEDRVRVNKNEPQLYGTQFRTKDGEHVPLPIEDEANVDERRRQMRLDSLAENLERMRQAYNDRH